MKDSKIDNKFIDSNNFTEKPLYTTKANTESYNIEISYNPFQKKSKNKKTSNFKYLQSSLLSTTFEKDGKSIEFIYNQLQGQCKYVICILIKDDSYINNLLLEKTLIGIKNNISSLEQTFIEPSNILICLFFNFIKNNEIFDEDDISTLKNENDFILLSKKYFVKKETYIDVHCIAKKNYFYDVEILKLFYCLLIDKIRFKNKIIFTSVIKVGIVPNIDILKTLIQLSYNSKDNHNIIVPLIEESDNDDLIYKIKKYERIHFNLYNMNFYDMTASVPIHSLLNVMTIDNNLFSDLNSFYNGININSSIDFHDYNLSLYLFKKNYKIIYYNSYAIAYIELSYFENNPIGDYQDSWIERYSGYYGNFFEIFKTFIDCNNFNIFKKIFMFFQIIGLLFEFIFPSLFILVIYSIFYEAFNTYDERPIAFCILLYIFILICSGASSLISKNSQKMQLTNLFYYFFIEVFYLFILICSVIAMDNVRKNKKLDSYKFNTAAITTIIILTFIPGILPLILKSALIFENIIPMLLYLLLGASPSSSFFYIAKILNASETCGGENIKERKGIIIIIYFLFNFFFGSLIFFNYNRKRRVETVMILAIIYLIYNFFKITAIIINLLINGKNLEISNITLEEIKNELDNKKDYIKNSRLSRSDNQNASQTIFKSNYFLIIIIIKNNIFFII